MTKRKRVSATRAWSPISSVFDRTEKLALSPALLAVPGQGRVEERGGDQSLHWVLVVGLEGERPAHTFCEPTWSTLTAPSVPEAKAPISRGTGWVKRNSATGISGAPDPPPTADYMQEALCWAAQRGL